MTAQATAVAQGLEPARPAADDPEDAEHRPSGRFWAMALGSIGVVFGDIGTSPLYAFRLALVQAAKRPLAAADILGVVSLAIWALILVVTVKYVLFLMRADNRGEGGVLSLMALAERAIGRQTRLILFLGLCGAALFYGDAVITPAMSVLSAVEGLRTVPGLGDRITPSVVLIVSMVLLVGLFLAQSRGTARMGAFFGPVTLVWFIVLAAIAVPPILAHPDVFLAFSPHEAIGFLLRHGFVGFLVLGSVFLTVTGAEALSADMGHFGRWPIQAAWLFLVLPALAIDYLGQGAFALGQLSAAQAAGKALGDQDWFFLMTPELLRIPMVLLAAAATIIASQAVITGAFSLTQQAISLGFLPRLVTRNTSEKHSGQIYLPTVNLLLMIGVLFLVSVFKTSAALGDAYGLAVTGTMVVTTSLAFVVVRRLWKWPLIGAVAFVGALLAIDLVFLSANLLKVLSGGYLPLAIAGALLLVMMTWRLGSRLVIEKIRRDSTSIRDVAAMLRARPPHRARGVAVFLTGDPGAAPTALMHNLKHNKVLHERNLLVHVRTARMPRIPDAERIKTELIDENFTLVRLKFGFMEPPNIPRALSRNEATRVNVLATTFYLGRRSIVEAPRSPLGHLRHLLYEFLVRNSEDPTAYFGIPAGRVVEVGTQVAI